MFGGSYTFDNGYVFNLEYRKHTEGYDDAEKDAYYDLVGLAADSLQRNDVNAPQSASVLLQASNPYLRALNQDYIYAQLLMRDIVDDLSINILASHNLDDHGSQFTFVVNYYLSDNWRLSGDFIVNRGGSDTEYGRYLGDVSFVGIKYFFD